MQKDYTEHGLEDLLQRSMKESAGTLPEQGIMNQVPETVEQLSSDNQISQSLTASISRAKEKAAFYKKDKERLSESFKRLTAGEEESSKELRNLEERQSYYAAQLAARQKEYDNQKQLCKYSRNCMEQMRKYADKLSQENKTVCKYLYIPGFGIDRSREIEQAVHMLDNEKERYQELEKHLEELKSTLHDSEKCIRETETYMENLQYQCIWRQEGLQIIVPKLEELEREAERWETMSARASYLLSMVVAGKLSPEVLMEIQKLEDELKMPVGDA